MSDETNGGPELRTRVEAMEAAVEGLRVAVEGLRGGPDERRPFLALDLARERLRACMPPSADPAKASLGLVAQDAYRQGVRLGLGTRGPYDESSASLWQQVALAVVDRFEAIRPADPGSPRAIVGETPWRERAVALEAALSAIYAAARDDLGADRAAGTDPWLEEIRARNIEGLHVLGDELGEWIDGLRSQPEAELAAARAERDAACSRVTEIAEAWVAAGRDADHAGREVTKLRADLRDQKARTAAVEGERDAAHAKWTEEVAALRATIERIDGTEAEHEAALVAEAKADTIDEIRDMVAILRPGTAVGSRSELLAALGLPSDRAAARALVLSQAELEAMGTAGHPRGTVVIGPTGAGGVDLSRVDGAPWRMVERPGLYIPEPLAELLDAVGLVLLAAWRARPAHPRTEPLDLGGSGGDVRVIGADEGVAYGALWLAAWKAHEAGLCPWPSGQKLSAARVRHHSIELKNVTMSIGGKDFKPVDGRAFVDGIPSSLATLDSIAAEVAMWAGPEDDTLGTVKALTKAMREVAEHVGRVEHCDDGRERVGCLADIVEGASLMDAEVERLRERVEPFDRLLDRLDALDERARPLARHFTGRVQRLAEDAVQRAAQLRDEIDGWAVELDVEELETIVEALALLAPGSVKEAT